MNHEEFDLDKELGLDYEKYDKIAQKLEFDINAFAKKHNTFGEMCFYTNDMLVRFISVEVEFTGDKFEGGRYEDNYLIHFFRKEKDEYIEVATANIYKNSVDRLVLNEKTGTIHLK